MAEIRERYGTDFSISEQLAGRLARGRAASVDTL